ncbi:helix-turn-helix domain-containing protein [Eubacterium limosum]|uniref:helix-turn-helix domain-containing protein n=1 Tax=Eubacterium limosum TaxID=1736 RepID=UPI001D078FC3|nr:helix-turn-helix transcriptional regulator [Eubacterium limosum]MCB6572246.1 helix-turn-helix domain-containing protein [Eubacterium limosum]
MKKKTVSLMKAFEMFADYVSASDLIAARLLSKISVAIFKKRLDLGLNQKEFAEKLEVSQAMVSKWESENYNYSIETLAKICDKLDLDIDITIEDKSAAYQYCDIYDDDWISGKSELMDAIKTNDEVKNLTLLECA